MDLARETVEDSAHRMDGLPEDKHDDATQRHDVEYLIVIVYSLQHAHVESAKDGDAVDGEVRG